MIELQNLLRAAQRRLWLGRFAVTVDRGLVIGNAVALLAVLWKLLIGAIAPGALAAAVAAPCVAALYWAGRARPTAESAARWVDERCSGQGMFATGLEFLLQSRRRGSPAALAALRARLERALPTAAARVAAERLPGKLRIALLSGSCVALCGFGLRLPGAAAGLRPAMARAEVRVAPNIVSPSADLRRAAERLRTALKESTSNAATRSRPAPNEDTGVVSRLTGLRASRSSPAATHPPDAARGDSTGDAGGREAGSDAPSPVAGPAAGTAAQFRAAFRDLASAHSPAGTPRAGHEWFELAGRARFDEGADFDARQRAAAPYALRADTPHEAPRAAESAAVLALQARYAALTAPLR